jgi:hypothetical protein
MITAVSAAALKHKDPIIKLATHRIGLTVPLALLVRADEVIE